MNSTPVAWGWCLDPQDRGISLPQGFGLWPWAGMTAAKHNPKQTNKQTKADGPSWHFAEPHLSSSAFSQPPWCFPAIRKSRFHRKWLTGAVFPETWWWFKILVWINSAPKTKCIVWTQKGIFRPEHILESQWRDTEVQQCGWKVAEKTKEPKDQSKPQVWGV